MSVVEITFPGNLAQVETIADLRALPSANFKNGEIYAVSDAGLYSFDTSSVAVDDGVSVLRPNDLTPLQAGRWLLNGTSFFAGKAQLAAPTGATLVGYQLPATASVPVTVAAQLATIPNAVDFGVVPDGSTINNAAMVKVNNFLRERSAGGFNTVQMNWPAGRIVHTNSLNWGIDRLHMHFPGETWWINAGSGDAFVMDAGLDDLDGILGMQITGFPLIYGNPGGGHGVYARGIHDGKFELNCRGAGTTKAGFYGEFLVDNRIAFTLSGNEGGLDNGVPMYGMHLTRRAPNEEVSYNEIDLRIAGAPGKRIPVGLYMDAALGNTIKGTIQQTTLGMETTENAWENKLRGMDFEANLKDFEDAGRRLLMDGCDFEYGGSFEATATGGRITGGRCESILVNAGATGILLDTTYNRTGAGTLVDNGTKTAYAYLYNISTAEYGKPRVVTELTVTTGAFAYTNNTAVIQYVIVSGGTVSDIVLSHPAGYSTGLTRGQFTLPPGDTITIQNTVAPLVTVFK